MRLLAVGCLAAGVASLAWFPPASLFAREAGARPQSAAASGIFLDASVTGEGNLPLKTLLPRDLQVTVDGERRAVLSLRYVYRGPGAEAAARLADPSRDAPAAAERTRLLLLVVDENAVYRGQQKAVVAAVVRVLDELGASDQVAVATLPRPPARLMLTASPAERMSDLARVIGRAESPGIAATQVRPQGATDPSDPSAGASDANPDERPSTRGEQLVEQEPDSDSGAGSPSAASLRALHGMIEGLATLPGLKTVVVFRQAESTNDATAPNPLQDASSAALAAAARARVVVHLVEVGQAGRRGSVPNDELGAIAVGSGGTTTAARNASDTRAFDGLRTALAGGYLVEVEGREGDNASRPRRVKVESARPKTTIRAPSLWAARQDPVPAVEASAPASAPPAAVPSSPPLSAAGPPPAAPRSRRSTADDPQLAIILARLSEYLAAYIRDFANVVAEEDYYQRFRRGSSRNAAVHLKSDLLLVATEDDIGWVQYRDVFEADGRAVRDREARVQQLFLENPANASRLARQISDEGARYNIGSQARNVNRPTLPLEYLSPSRIGGMSFWLDGDDSIDGVAVVKLGFEEVSRPTLVQSDSSGEEVPALGTFWVDPVNGRILRTWIRLKAGAAQMVTTVVYKPAQGLGLLAPSEMNERYDTPMEDIEGNATYRNFRSFKVTTNVEVKK